jgi:serpin B
VVISPLSLTLILGALQSNLDWPLRSEISNAFGWSEYTHLDVPARMLLVAFEEPPPAPVQPVQPKRGILAQGLPKPSREAAWITNSFLYADKNKDSFSPGFVANAQKFYGVTFKGAEEARPRLADLKDMGHSPKALPSISDKNDFLIASGSHLQTAWSGNTFSMGRKGISGFGTSSGEVKQVPMLATEMNSYPYAKTDKFEAVALPCNHAYMIAVMPSPGQSIRDLERLLIESPDSIDKALVKQLGVVAMPTFHFQFDASFRQELEQMGIRGVFEDLGRIVKIPKSHLTDVSQKTDIQVDGEGIRVDSETVVGGVVGGITSGQFPFHMELTRPFIFLIRDRTTNALLFLGVVADPTQS